MACSGVEDLLLLADREEEIEKTQDKKRQLILLLHSMVQKQMLSIQQGKIVLMEVYRRVMHCMQQAHRIWYVESQWSSKLYQGILYWGEDPVWLQKDPYCKDMLQLQFLSCQGLLEMMAQMEFYEIFHSPCQVSPKEKSIILPPREQCLFWLAETGQTGECTYYNVAVFEHQGRLYIAKGSEGELLSCPYHQDFLCQSLRERGEWLCSLPSM